MLKFTEKIKKELQKAFTENKKEIEKIKESSEEKNGKFRVVMTKQTKDRDGEVVLVAGGDSSYFEKNPVVLFGHDYWSLPIGKVTNIIKEEDQWIAEGVFASEEANPLAQQVRKLYDAGIIKAVSIGFITKDWEGNLIKEWELLELSFVPVPSNRDALDTVKSLQLENEFKSILESAEKKGVELPDYAVKFLKDAKHSDPVESKDSIKALAEVMKELVAEVKNLKSSIEENKKEIEKIAKGVNPKGSDEELSKFLDDVKASNQMINRLSSNLGAKFNQLKK